MHVLEVFADVSCPFAHAGLRRFEAYRSHLGRTEPVLRVRAWPLELVNGRALDGPSLTPKVAALRADVAKDLFVGFDEHRFPATALAAMAAEAAAYRRGERVGERFSFAIREALFEHGLDVSDASVLQSLLDQLGVPEPTGDAVAHVDDLCGYRVRLFLDLAAEYDRAILCVGVNGGSGQPRHLSWFRPFDLEKLHVLAWPSGDPALEPVDADAIPAADPFGS